MTILDALRGVNAYPIPFGTIAWAAELRRLPLEDRATSEVLTGAAYNLVRADLLLWLSSAPDIAQGGQTYSFTDEQRAAFRRSAYALYKEWDCDGGAPVPKAAFGYKGSRL